MSARSIFEISLKDYYKHNKTCTVKDIYYARCSDCLGTGYKDKYDHFCIYCNGGKYKYRHICKYCNGTGKKCLYVLKLYATTVMVKDR